MAEKILLLLLHTGQKMSKKWQKGRKTWGNLGLKPRIMALFIHYQPTVSSLNENSTEIPKSTDDIVKITKFDNVCQYF